jgi:hypothetical protein
MGARIERDMMRQPGSRWLATVAIAALSLGALCGGPVGGQAPATSAAAAHPQAPAGATPDALPFFVGERLEYQVSVARLGRVGRATMWVDGPQPLHGVQAYVLRFAFDARKGPVRATDRTESWLDPVRLAALRFQKHERHVLSRHDEQVEMDPTTGRWTADDGEQGESASAAPLDELSFMFFLRTLPARGDSTWRLDRHFDARRNPTMVRVVGRETIATGAGTFRAVVLEMRVRDARRYRGTGVIRIALSDDHCRIPLRIESEMPVVGRATLTLTAQNHAPRHHWCGARGEGRGAREVGRGKDVRAAALCAPARLPFPSPLTSRPSCRANPHAQARMPHESSGDRPESRRCRQA